MTMPDKNVPPPEAELGQEWRTDVARIWRKVYGGTRCDASAFEFAAEIEAAAVAAERERWVKWCSHEMNMHRRELDATGRQRHRGAADALERAVHACGG